MTTYWLKTRPYTLIDAINRCAVATGSMRNAMAGSQADYNGHSVSVSFNTYRKYWVAEYFWAGRMVLGRGEFEDCVRVAKREYDRGALGAEVRVTDVTTPEQVTFLESLGFEVHTPEISKAWYNSWADDRHGLVGIALRNGTDHILLKSKDEADYWARLSAGRNR